MVRKKRRSPQFRAWQAVGLSLVIAVFSVAAGVTVFFITGSAVDTLLEGKGGQWTVRFGIALGVLIFLGTFALSVADLVKSMKLKAWHLMLGAILWILATVLGFIWWLYNYVIH